MKNDFTDYALVLLLIALLAIAATANLMYSPFLVHR